MSVSWHLWKLFFSSLAVGPTLEPTQSQPHCVPGDPSARVKRVWRDGGNLSHLVVSLRTSGALLPLSLRYLMTSAGRITLRAVGQTGL